MLGQYQQGGGGGGGGFFLALRQIRGLVMSISGSQFGCEFIVPEFEYFLA